MNIDKLIFEFRKIEKNGGSGRKAILDCLETTQLLPLYRKQTKELWHLKDSRNIDNVRLSMLEDKELRAIKCYGHCRSTSLVYWHLMGGKGPKDKALKRYAQHLNGQLVHFWLKEDDEIIDLTADQTPLLPMFDYSLGKERKTTRAEHQGKFQISHSGKKYRLTDREWTLLRKTLALLWG